MIPLSHIVKLSIFDPKNIKNKIGSIEFEISYVVVKSWNHFAILVNGYFCGEQFNICHVGHDVGKIPSETPIKNAIAASIRRYFNLEEGVHQTPYKITCGDFWNEINSESLNILLQAFKTHIFSIKTIHSRDFISANKLILKFTK